MVTSQLPTDTKASVEYFANAAGLMHFHLALLHLLTKASRHGETYEIDLCPKTERVLAVVKATCTASLVSDVLFWP